MYERIRASSSKRLQYRIASFFTAAKLSTAKFRSMIDERYARMQALWRFKSVNACFVSIFLFFARFSRTLSSFTSSCSIISWSAWNFSDFSRFLKRVTQNLALQSEGSLISCVIRTNCLELVHDCSLLLLFCDFSNTSLRRIFLLRSRFDLVLIHSLTSADTPNGDDVIEDEDWVRDGKVRLLRCRKSLRLSELLLSWLE
mmetsp:Transcript_7010/g.11540  ORF Transcript_7010/g.11540 Transcript_7010/m.11540 type:complete len:200 (+) Transcript_7010:1785-2384(+)